MQNSKIEWTDHTFQPWIGCVKVSPGCENCYAMVQDKRYGHSNWGPAKTTQRRPMSDNYWKQPLRWNAAAERAGQRARVFCASMADVFEDHPQVADWRMRLFNLIDMTPNLDWLLLTKRPENIMPMMADWLEGTAFPSNIWIGTSVENQEWADKRIPHLLQVPARVRFLSCEPLLGPLNLRVYLENLDWGDGPKLWPDELGTLDWVICGGESGYGARPMHPDWARALQRQCAAAGVAFFFKQHGEYLPRSQMIPGVHCSEGEQVGQPDDSFLRMGKHAAGRLLDGREWNEVPA